MKIIAKIAMLVSLTYYTVTSVYIWFGQILGVHNDIWAMFDFPIQATSPSLWSLVIGSLLTSCILISLGLSYRALWMILEGGAKQDFRCLAKLVRHLSVGLFGFWFFYNLTTAIVQYLIVIGLKTTEGFEFGYDLLDTDIVFVILAIAFFSISQNLQRAWEAEEENRQFL